MSTVAMKNESVEPAAIRAWTEKRTIYIELTDGRIIGFPASRFKLLAAAPEEKLKGLQFWSILCCFSHRFMVQTILLHSSLKARCKNVIYDTAGKGTDKYPTP